MILAPHFLAGASLSVYIKNPILLAASSIFIHFLLDKIPHWDYKIFDYSKSKAIAASFSDLLVGIIAVVSISFLSGWSGEQYYLAFIGVFFGLLPDGLLLLHRLLPDNSLLLKYFSFKKSIHSKTRLDFKYGFPQEFFIASSAILILLF